MKNAVSCDLRTLAPFMPSIIVTLVFTSTFVMIGSGGVGGCGKRQRDDDVAVRIFPCGL